MKPLVVVELKVMGETRPRLARGSVIMQVDLLIFDGTLQALSEDVIESATATIHANLDLSVDEQSGVLGIGEVSALIAVPDGRSR
jgi:hypothetical protein